MPQFDALTTTVVYPAMISSSRRGFHRIEKEASDEHCVDAARGDVHEHHTFCPGCRNALVDRVPDLNLTEAQAAKIAGICRRSASLRFKKRPRNWLPSSTKKWKRFMPCSRRSKKQKFRRLGRNAEQGQKPGRDIRAPGRLGYMTDAEMSQIADVRKQFGPRMEKTMEGFRSVALTDGQRRAPRKSTENR